MLEVNSTAVFVLSFSARAFLKSFRAKLSARSNQLECCFGAVRERECGFGASSQIECCFRA
eukprot:722880-Rhodomonas_salina.3